SPNTRSMQGFRYDDGAGTGFAAEHRRRGAGSALGEPAFELRADDPLVVNRGGLFGGEPHDRGPMTAGSSSAARVSGDTSPGSIRGATARATRNTPVIFVSITSRKPPGGTSQNGCGSVRNRGFTVRIPIPALLTRTSNPPHSS